MSKIKDYGNYKNKGKLAATRILIVEDDTVNITIMRLFLLELGVETIAIANNSKAALSHLQNNFELIFLDIGLPDLNGIELCKKIRELPTGNKVPIVAITSFDSDMKEICVDAGMNGFIRKPINLEELQKIIDEFI